MAHDLNNPHFFSNRVKPWHGIEYPLIDLSSFFNSLNFERINNMKILMPAGNYYIGDLCYVIDYDWSKLCDHYFCNDAYGRTQDGMTFPYEDRKCFIGSTKYGDGSYYDNFGREYGVDSGTIGIMLYALRDKDDGGGNVVFFDKEFYVDYFDGIFSFGDIVINTGEEEEYDDFYPEDDVFDDYPYESEIPEDEEDEL